MRDIRKCWPQFTQAALAAEFTTGLPYRKSVGELLHFLATTYGQDFESARAENTRFVSVGNSCDVSRYIFKLDTNEVRVVPQKW